MANIRPGIHLNARDFLYHTMMRILRYDIPKAACYIRLFLSVLSDIYQSYCSYGIRGTKKYV